MPSWSYRRQPPKDGGIHLRTTGDTPHKHHRSHVHVHSHDNFYNIPTTAYHKKIRLQQFRCSTPTSSSDWTLRSSRRRFPPISPSLTFEKCDGFTLIKKHRKHTKLSNYHSKFIQRTKNLVEQKIISPNYINRTGTVNQFGHTTNKSSRLTG